MARVAWTLTDNSTGSPVVLSFEINPNAADYPGRNASISEEAGTSPTSSPILFQGRDKIPQFKFSGKVRGQSFYQDLNTWMDKWYPLVLADDLGNTWNVLTGSWSFKRINRHKEPWTFDVTVELRVLP
jgi:hypothetical protein